MRLRGSGTTHTRQGALKNSSLDAGSRMHLDFVRLARNQPSDYFGEGVNMPSVYYPVLLLLLALPLPSIAVAVVVSCCSTAVFIVSTRGTVAVV